MNENWRTTEFSFPLNRSFLSWSLVLTDTAHRKSTDCCSLRTKGRQHTGVQGLLLPELVCIWNRAELKMSRRASSRRLFTACQGVATLIEQFAGKLFVSSCFSFHRHHLIQLQVFIGVLLICNEGCVSAAGRIDHTFSCSPPVHSSRLENCDDDDTWLYPERVLLFTGTRLSVFEGTKFFFLATVSN